MLQMMLIIVNILTLKKYGTEEAIRYTGGNNMTTVFDVAKYILIKQGTMTAMKLQKLVYYCQAWSLVWDEEPLFNEKIEAWANGPVVRELFHQHKGLFSVSGNDFNGDVNSLSQKQKNTIDAILSYYGDKSSQWLSDLTHAEDPWRLARRGLDDGDRGFVEISHSSMAEYYLSLQPDPQ